MAAKSPRKAPLGATSGDANAKDLVLVHGQDTSGNLQVLRKKRDRIELGALRPVRDGQPIDGELVKLTPRPEAPVLFDSQTLYAPPRSPSAEDGDPPSADRPAEPRLSADGPAQVASAAYRASWNRIFGSGGKTGRGGAPN